MNAFAVWGLVSALVALMGTVCYMAWEIYRAEGRIMKLKKKLRRSEGK